MIIAGKSVIIYHGKIEKNTSYQKVAIDETVVKSILTRKKKHSDKTPVLLKLSAEATSAGLMDKVYNLKQWTIESGFHNFSFADATPEELAVFKLEPFTWSQLDSIFSGPRIKLNMPKDEPAEDEKKPFPSPDLFEPPPPVEIKTPESISSSEMPVDNSFLIEMRKDGSVWYQFFSKTSKMRPQEISPPITKNLSSAIANHEQSMPDVKTVYLIKGHPDLPYKTFEQVVNALKENNIYKYNIVTTEK